MSGANFDLVALSRAVVISVGVGLIIAAIGYFVMIGRSDWGRSRAVLVMGSVGVVLLVVVGVFYAWPNLVVVPSLANLGQAEAEQLLGKRGLVPQGRPQYVVGVEAGRVIPHSQSPGAGLSVQPGTVVTFAVSAHGASVGSAGGITDPSGLDVSLFEPKSRGKVLCSRGGDNIYRFQVTGASSGLSGNENGLLLWIRPVQPPSDTPGWYLQRPPTNGIERIESDGAWMGVAQIGNAMWPPHEGDVLDIAVSIADRGSIAGLISEPGVVVRNQPVGIKLQTALGVAVTMKP